MFEKTFKYASKVKLGKKPRLLMLALDPTATKGPRDQKPKGHFGPINIPKPPSDNLKKKKKKKDFGHFGALL